MSESLAPQTKRRRQHNISGPEGEKLPVATEPQEGTLVNRQDEVRKVRDCPYLSSIKRNRLDFDVERVCSVTGERFNIYACLVCGQFLKGRGKMTPAFDHSLSHTSPHNLFISLTNAAVYCLPDNYEVLDACLDDIKFNLFPSYTSKDIDVFERITKAGAVKPEDIEMDGDGPVTDRFDSLDRGISKALNGIEYLPGLQGLNSINDRTDYMNVVFHLVAGILPYRRFLLSLEAGGGGDGGGSSGFRIALSNLMKQMFNYRSFKGMILPQALCLFCERESGSVFSLTAGGNAKDFLLWMLNELIKVEGKMFSRLVRGSLAIEKEIYDSRSGEASPEIKKFIYLSLSLGGSPLLNTSSVANQPDEPHLHELLQQFSEQSHNAQRIFLWKLPPYLITHVQRFTKNNFFQEKNTTMVKSPTKGLDLAEFMHPDAPKSKEGTRYSLAANIVHVGDAQSGKYVIQIARGDQWYEIEDLRVIPIDAYKAAVSQCFIQMWRRE